MTDQSPFPTDLIMKKITIKGFRGLSQPIEINLSRDATFLIGRNGTGKTTLINIVSDCLQCRYQSLMAAPFDSAEVIFESNANKNSVLTVTKNYDKDGDVEEIRFFFADLENETPSFDHSIKSRLYRRSEDYGGPASQRRILNEFSKRFRLTWLALNRAAGIAKSLSEPAGDLDAKLEHSFQKLATYFTRLDSRFSVELQKFQQEWFMSLLVSSKKENALSVVQKIDPDEEDRQIREMLSGIGIRPNDYSSKVERHIQAITNLSSSKLQHLHQKDEVERITDSYDISKLHFLVEQWLELQKTKAEIYSTKEKFVAIANSMLYKKTLSVDAGNKVILQKPGSEKLENMAEKDLRAYRKEILIGRISQPGEIKYSDLSSGEKQLLIFLAETALRSGSPYIFIADEPELSLHIEWQEKLVPVILELSPEAQIFFATHSPDIVNGYRKNVFSMEDFSI